MSYMEQKELLQSVVAEGGTRDSRDAEINLLRGALEEAHKEIEHWKKRCCEAEDRLNFTQARDTDALISENHARRADLERKHKELMICQAQLDIVYRIFPEPVNCGCR